MVCSIVFIGGSPPASAGHFVDPLGGRPRLTSLIPSTRFLAVRPDTKLHRWLGFVQCGMLANNILDFEEAKALFDKAKIAHGGAENDDLNDHLDPDSSFKLEIGGQG